MKKIYFVFAAVLVAVTFISCEKDDPVVTSISVPNEVTLDAGSSKKITVTHTPSDLPAPSYVWETSDNSIFTVDNNGNITGLKVGEGTLTVKAPTLNLTASCKVKVTPVNATSISLSQQSANLLLGSSLKLEATILPENTTDKSVLWKSGNETIATVANDGTVQAVGVGKTTITAAVERNIYATCNVKVIPLTKNIQLNEPGTLKDLISLEELPKIGYLSISGPLNGTDIFIIREKMTSLVNLDMENARIVSGGMPYYMQQTTTDNTIGNNMFEGKKTLESIILPKTIKSIGDYAFKGCSNLKSIYIKNPIPIIITSDTFEGVSKTDCTLFVPTGSFESYWFAFGWSEFQNIKEMDF